MPMVETMAAFNLVDHLWHGVFGEPEKGLGYPRMLTPHRRPYATTDGHVCLLATTDRQWRNLFAAIGAPELADDPRFATIAARTANIDVLYGWLAERAEDREHRRVARPARRGRRAEWRGQRPDGRRRRPLSARQSGSSETVEHPTEGQADDDAVPGQLLGDPGERDLPPPRLGEHTEAILAELGYNGAEIIRIAGN